MLENDHLPNFEQAVLPHLDAAYNLARWLTRNEQDAEDVVQEAYLRAFRFFPGFRGGDARAWLMKIVRNTCFTWLDVSRPLQDAMEFDRTFSLLILAVPIQKKLYSKTTAALCCERR
jgi:RNA polymerase sigma factor (sigma-70 family)